LHACTDPAEIADQHALEQPLATAQVIVGCQFSFSASIMRAHFANVGILVLDEFADSMWLQTISKCGSWLFSFGTT
jgi:hypothetical protein